MAILYLMRHAKSDWHNHLSDIKRPLNARGRADAPRIGAELAARNARPGVILGSPANRARATAEAIAAAFTTPPPIEIIDSLYLADAKTLRHHLLAAGEPKPMLVAHNPGLDDLLAHLCGDDLPYTRNGKLMTTANVAIIDLDGARGHLVDLIRPKDLT